MSTKTNSGMKTYVPTPPSSQQQAQPTLLNLLARRPVSQPQRPQSSQSRPTTAPPPPSPRTPRKKAPPHKKPQTARAYESPKQLNIVLPPRRFSSLSSSCLADCSTTSVVNNEVKINCLHFSDLYTPHKEYWIRNALEKLGNTWVRDKNITQTELVSKAFEEKMGVLYELAMAKKHESIDRLVDEVQDEEVVKEKKKSKRRKKPIEPPVLQDNFPFSPQLSDTLKRTMSSLLLDIMKQGQQGQGEQKKPTQQRVLDKKPHDKMDESLSSLGSVAKTPLTQCYVLDGKLVVGGKKLLAIGGSILNQFADTSKSRVRSSTEEKSYFRKTANMMGFLSHEISIRYCKKGYRIIVSGSRAQRNDSENARQVREVVLVPKDVSIHGLLVMRTTKGSLIFEEPNA